MKGAAPTACRTRGTATAGCCSPSQGVRTGACSRCRSFRSPAIRLSEIGEDTAREVGGVPHQLVVLAAKVLLALLNDPPLGCDLAKRAGRIMASDVRCCCGSVRVDVLAGAENPPLVASWIV